MGDENTYDSIRKKFDSVNERIIKAALSSGRDPKDVKLIVVTKGHTTGKIINVLNAGAKNLGENYIEEAIPKIEELSSYNDIDWHMIGHVQSRKARSVSEYFHWIDSLDSIKLANRLDRFANEQERDLSILIEFNISGEDTKFGFPAYDQRDWGNLVDSLRPVLSLSNIKVHGLMTMAPFITDPEEVRPYFQKLHRLQEFLKGVFPTSNWEELSMGMSSDFEVAIQEGATMVRIGQAILGPRHT